MKLGPAAMLHIFQTRHFEDQPSNTQRKENQYRNRPFKTSENP